MKYLYFFILIIFLSSCDTDEDIIAPKLDEYDLEVISYFKEIALGFEFGSASKITRKWCYIRVYYRLWGLFNHFKFEKDFICK